MPVFLPPEQKLAAAVNGLVVLLLPMPCTLELQTWGQRYRDSCPRQHLHGVTPVKSLQPSRESRTPGSKILGEEGQSFSWLG